jgi:hypothetical protein
MHTSLFFRAENYSENNYNLHRPSYSSIAELGGINERDWL